MFAGKSTVDATVEGVESAIGTWRPAGDRTNWPHRRQLMAFDPAAVGRAFSEHRFDEALGHLARTVRWTIVGYMVLEGADAVRQTCRETAASLEDTTTTYDRCVVAAGTDVVAVDTFARYRGPSGLTAVASCDIYEFEGDEIAAITSYAVEVDPESAGSQPPPRGAE